MEMHLSRLRQSSSLPLLQAGADPNVQHENGTTALHSAVQWNSVESTTLLLEVCPSVSVYPGLHTDSHARCPDGTRTRCIPKQSVPALRNHYVVSLALKTYFVTFGLTLVPSCRDYQAYVVRKNHVSYVKPRKWVFAKIT